MAAVIDEYMDSPMENEDVFPCKGCGDILEEGKAFELAGNRWHLNCFRCNTCGTLLDSDANLLLLGDGSLICNSCTYSCNACGNKIEELAILTGEQAFCATCFRCRNCKRKIENLRYARTSQGIFCMSCHESLMARRRKKSKAAAALSKSREKDGSPMITDKSLPALPPNAIPPNAFSETRVDPESDTPTELSPRPRPAYTKRDSDSRTRSNSRPTRSPERPSNGTAKDGLGLSPASYRNNPIQSSPVAPGSHGADANGRDDAFFIPVALDPTPSSNTSRSVFDNHGDPSKRKEREQESDRDRDYFTQVEAGSEKKSDSQPSTPHIAFQEMGRQSSSDMERPKLPLRKTSKSSRNESSVVSPAAEERPQKVVANRPPPSAQDEFKLQDAPKSKKSAGARSTGQSPETSQSDEGFGKGANGGLRKESLSGTPLADSPPQPGPRDQNREPKSSQDSKRKDESDSQPSTDAKAPPRPEAPPEKSIARKELPPGARAPNSKQAAPPLTRSTTEDSSSPRSSISRTAAQPEGKRGDSYMQPRVPPQLPPSGAPGKEAPTSSDGKSEKASPKLPRWSSGGDFTMDEDMARILGTDEPSSSLLRRVSNAVRHGRTNSTESAHHHGHHRVGGHARSASETTRGTMSPRWPKSSAGVDDPANGHSRDISSPLSITSTDDPAFLKRQLRNSELKVAELERQFHTEKDIKHLNKKLIEKRKTVSTLDTQTEIMIRQLEVLAGYVERAKETKSPVDPRALEDSAIKDFVQKLDRVKYSMSEVIEQLHAERDELIEEKDQAMADRDRALLEFEQLSAKNAQLADLNNDLTHQIQGRFKSQLGDTKSPPGGLGIYGQSKEPSGSSVNLAEAASVNTATTLLPADAEEPVVEARPTVVDIRKGQAKKFNWKKGSKTMAQNIAKGVNRTVGAFQQERDMRHQGLTADNIGMPYNMTVSQVESPVTPVSSNGGAQSRYQQQLNESRQGFGFFKKNNNVVKSTSNTNLGAPAAAEPPSTLFGSELLERADYERRHIPSVVTRCIEEVELRGMDIEGIYRKTGGTSQVKMVQEGFDKNQDYDTSDPELDITAVTSVLKQYFRKLPTPLLIFEIYDKVLESNAIVDTTERCDFLRKTFASMPQHHRDCLEFLMFHLSRVAKREPENLMSPKNLAVVFAPTIMRDTSLEREMTDMHAKNLAVQFVVENSNTIFTES